MLSDRASTGRCQECKTQNQNGNVRGCVWWYSSVHLSSGAVLMASIVDCEVGPMLQKGGS